MFTLMKHAHTSRGSGNIWEQAVQAQQAEQQHTEPQTIPVLFAFSELSRFKHEISFVLFTLTPPHRVVHTNGDEHNELKSCNQSSQMM